MSAPNFYNKNASRIFAVEETDEDSENWSDAMGNIACDLKGYKKYPRERQRPKLSGD